MFVVTGLGLLALPAGPGAAWLGSLTVGGNPIGATGRFGRGVGRRRSHLLARALGCLRSPAPIVLDRTHRRRPRFASVPWTLALAG
jgi:hypothetical protein